MDEKNTNFIERNKDSLKELIKMSIESFVAHAGFDIYRDSTLYRDKYEFAQAKMINLEERTFELGVKDSYRYINGLMSQLMAEVAEQTKFEFDVLYVKWSEMCTDGKSIGFNSLLVETTIQLSCSKKTTRESLTDKEFKKLFDDAIKRVLE